MEAAFSGCWVVISRTPNTTTPISPLLKWHEVPQGSLKRILSRTQGYDPGRVDDPEVHFLLCFWGPLPHECSLCVEIQAWHAPMQCKRFSRVVCSYPIELSQKVLYTKSANLILLVQGSDSKQLEVMGCTRAPAEQTNGGRQQLLDRLPPTLRVRGEPLRWIARLRFRCLCFGLLVPGASSRMEVVSLLLLAWGMCSGYSQRLWAL